MTGSLVEKYTEQLNYYAPKNSPVILNPNYEAYGPYVALFQNNGIMEIDLRAINKNNISQHFDAILDILRDGIETEQVQKHMKIYATYADGVRIPFSLFDYFINIIFWYLPVACDELITSEYFIYEKDGFTQKSIKNYIDYLFLNKHREQYHNIWLNNTIDDSIYRFIYIDDFSDYFMNTFNNEDTTILMELDKEFNDAVHVDISGVPIEDVKKVGEAATKTGINCIKRSEFHWGVPFFKARQGINEKQYRQFQFNIGTEPDGNKGVFPTTINSSYSNGGANTVIAMVMEAEVARVAQILQRNNVGSSGANARLLSINNIDTKIYPDLNYFCETKNTVLLFIEDEHTLNRLKGRYYKFSKKGIIKRIPSNPVETCSHLIGQTIMLYSPLTCASHARGEGYCRRCYGDLAYTNNDINPGKFAAEELSAQLIQRMLSAKHLLESNVIALKWVPEFLQLFSIECNIITTIEGLDYRKFKLIINSEDIEYSDDIDSFDYNMYVTSFTVQYPNGATVSIHTEAYDDIYIAQELSEAMARKKPNENGDIILNLDTLQDSGLFVVHLNNVELSEALDDVLASIDKQSVTDQLKTKDAILQRLMSAVNRSGLNTESVHLEVLLSNQVRNHDNIIEMPEWQYENEEYQMLTLKSALTNHPCIGISLEYSRLAKAMYNPLSFMKTKSSVVDLFYMVKPQEYMSKEPIPTVRDNDDELISPFVIKQDPNFVPDVVVTDEDSDTD